MIRLFTKSVIALLLFFIPGYFFGQTLGIQENTMHVALKNVDFSEDSLHVHFENELPPHSTLTICDDFGREKYRTNLCLHPEELRLSLKNFHEGEYLIIVRTDLDIIDSRLMNYKK